MKLCNLLQVMLCLLFCVVSYGQNKLVGKVMDFKKKPLIDVLVYLDDRKTDVLINQRGYFELVIPEDVKVINLYSPKYGLLRTQYSGESRMSFMFLNPDQKVKVTEGDIVDIGYGQVDREDLSYNVQKLNAEKEGEILVYDDIYDLIRGRLRGVTVTKNNKIIIRGAFSLYASTDPLFVVDGIIVYNIDNIRPNEVKDISVLKGASASIYGARGANGVILITLIK